ncbi:MAG: AAA family ATPase [Desulfuromonadales bacterium GWD2_61_12]|nr:MAG: AAA family ATPase [Desulfuromonadales bacterium GWC2_61_20]OGR33947.1 MAG: AAA family ATPase [Desulfuromonadales bacterium GWD2_61_12]HAD05142.1 AAA family ATPase [Desulfuromonas sp.]HBT82729.1 AAA family ATPase [Desulfuromonas sp.]
MPLDSHVVAQLGRVLASLEQLLPKAVPAIDWTSCPAANWRRHSLSGYLEPMLENDGVTLDGLLGIDEQKRVVEENTRQFLAGHPANNILLWGSRGTGKSSLVRALLNQYIRQGLRVVQVDKEDLVHLPDIFTQIAPRPYKFIIFCDDLSFEEGEKSYKVLKSALDGSVYASPANTLIYVTSNRRHLLPEYKSDNFGSYLKGGEIHHGETVEEKISLSDRFGLWVAFSPFSQEHYLNVVRHCIAVLAGESGTNVPWNRETEVAALAWSHDKSKSCGRTALQFAKHWVGQQLLHGHTSQS